MRSPTQVKAGGFYLEHGIPDEYYAFTGGEITQKVRQYKKLGAEVIRMTPTYTDERFPTVFNVAMTRRFLEALHALTQGGQGDANDFHFGTSMVAL